MKLWDVYRAGPGDGTYQAIVRAETARAAQELAAYRFARSNKQAYEAWLQGQAYELTEHGEPGPVAQWFRRS